MSRIFVAILFTIAVLGWDVSGAQFAVDSLPVTGLGATILKIALMTSFSTAWLKFMVESF